MEMPIKAHGYGRECPISAFVPSGPVINVSGWTCGWDFAYWAALQKQPSIWSLTNPDCLEKRITDRRTEKPESPPFHVPAHGFRLRRNSGNLSQSAEMVNNGLMIGEKRQDVPVKTAEFFLNGHKQFRIIDSADCFQTVFDNSIKSHQPSTSSPSSAPLSPHKVMEGSPVSFALPEDSKPG